MRGVTAGDQSPSKIKLNLELEAQISENSEEFDSIELQSILSSKNQTSKQSNHRRGDMSPEILKNHLKNYFNVQFTKDEFPEKPINRKQDPEEEFTSALIQYFYSKDMRSILIESIQRRSNQGKNIQKQESVSQVHAVPDDDDISIDSDDYAYDCYQYDPPKKTLYMKTKTSLLNTQSQLEPLEDKDVKNRLNDIKDRLNKLKRRFLVFRYKGLAHFWELSNEIKKQFHHAS